MVESTDLALTLSEAFDIAQSVNQRATTAHLLLAMFTVENRAALLLAERSVDEDKLLALLDGAPTEAEGLLRELRAKAKEIAETCNQPEADCLHVLIAMTRMRCAGQELLARAGIDLTALRNTALGYYASGRMPRKLLLQSELPGGKGRPLGAAPLPKRPALRTQVMPPLPLAIPSVQELVDELDEEPAPAEADEASATTLAAKETLSYQAAPSTESFAPMPAPVAPPQTGLDAAKYPLLTSLGRNLTALAKAGLLDPVLGRAREIDELIDVLGKRRTNNPLLIGDPGVGKTAIVEGAAQHLLTLAPPHRSIIELDMGSLVAGTQLRGSFSERLLALKEEVKRSEGNVVVFIDELHTLIGAGATGEGPQDAANELKAAMARGEFPCIGATTHEEYRKHFSNDAAFERRFTPIVVREPTQADAVYIIGGIINRYAQHHKLNYAPEALQAAVSLSAKYITDRRLPDKAISVLDLAGSRCRREGRPRVESSDIASVVAKLAGLPQERLQAEEATWLLALERFLQERLIGHTDVVGRVAKVIRRNYAGFASRRPMGSFLFLGPTGVGKTELGRALAAVVFGTSDALIRFDMSELSEGHSISRLIGAPAGYVGYGDGGQLTEAVRRRPSSVVVLDEIEKAHPDVLMLLLQVLEEGQLSDAKGRLIDFANTIIVLTSNLGAKELSQKNRGVGFNSQDSSAQNDGEAAALAAAKRSLPPELWNRIDERCVFRPLTRDEVARIASLLLSKSSETLDKERHLRFEVTPEVIDYLLVSGGYDSELGARPMRSTIQRLVEGPLAERVLAGDFVPGDVVQVGMAQGALSFTVST